MNFLLLLSISLLMAHILGSLFSRFNLPKMLGHMITGFILGIPAIKEVIFSQTNLGIFSGLSDLGIIFLLYYIGLEMDIKGMLKLSKSAIIVSVLSAAVPFVLGYIFSMIYGFNLVQSIVIAASLAVTAEAVSAAILDEFNLVKTTVGRLILGAGMFDDIFEILLLLFVSTIINPNVQTNGFLSIYEVLLDLVIFALIIYFIRYFFTPILMRMTGKKISNVDMFVVSAITALFMAVASETLEFGTVVGALIAGIIIKMSMKGKDMETSVQKNAVDFIKVLTFGLLEPIFFIWIGLSTDIGALILNPWVGLVLTLFATSGKIMGALISQYIIKQPLFEALVIGIGMNPRGVVGIIAAEMARANGLIDSSIYSAIVFMSFATTIISPILLSATLRRHHKRLKGGAGR